MARPRRQQPRAPVPTLPAELRPRLRIGRDWYDLRNMSLGGLGIWTPEPLPKALEFGSTHDAELDLNGTLYAIQVEVRHHEPHVVGLSMRAPSSELADELTRILEPACLAGRLQPEGPQGEEDPQNGFARLWYTTPGAELLVWFTPGSGLVAAVQITWRAHVVFRHQQRPIETAELHDEPLRPAGNVHRVETFRARHAMPDPRLVRDAAQFLAALEPPLPAALLWQFLETGEQVYLPASSVQKTEVA